MTSIDTPNEQGKKRTRGNREDSQFERIELAVQHKIIEDETMKNQLRVLCADDDDTCELLNTTLGISNIEVKSAYTVADAWRLVQTEPFDLYLLETRLPDGDGFDLCRRLHKFAPRTPIVFYSCEAYPVDRQKGLAAGAVAYLVKPYFDDLAATILQIIKTTRNSPSLIPEILPFNGRRRIVAQTAP